MELLSSHQHETGGLQGLSWCLARYSCWCVNFITLQQWDLWVYFFNAKLESFEVSFKWWLQQLDEDTQQHNRAMSYYYQLATKKHSQQGVLAFIRQSSLCLNCCERLVITISSFYFATCQFYLDVLHCHCPNSQCLWTGVVSHVWHFYELTCQLLVAGWDGHAVSACLRPVALWSPEVENILHQNGNCDEISWENKRVPNVFVRLCKCMPSNLVFVKSECRSKMASETCKLQVCQ